MKLLRFFKIKGHANDFAEGRVRFQTIESYRHMEEQIKDETEGESSFCWDVNAPMLLIDKTKEIISGSVSDQKIKSNTTIANTVYILCTSMEGIDKKKVSKELGKPFYVEICDPDNFLEKINEEWLKLDIASQKGKWYDVEYTKGDVFEPNEGLIPPWGLEIYQKPPKSIFMEEKEKRLALICRLDGDRKDPDVLWITINPSSVLSNVYEIQ